jgi:dihydroorotate dehydrogenase
LVAKSLHADVLSAIHQGIVGGWSWFTGLPPIQPLAPVAEDRELSKDIFEALISTDGKETEAAVRDLIEDLAGHSPSHFQSYTRTEGGMTAVYLRVSRDPIRRRGPVVRPALTLFLKGALLTASAEGAPIRSINLSDVARRSKLGDRVGPVVTSCLLSLMDSEKWTGLSEKRAREIVSEAIQDRWGDFSQDIVEAHRRAMDLTRTELVSPHPAVTLLTPPNNDVSKEQNSPSRCADLHSDYMGFRLRSPLIACVSGASGDDLRASLASAPIGAVFFGPVSEEELDREAWKTFSALNRGDRSEGFKARPPLDRQLELVRVWKSSVEAPVIAGISAVTEKNWLAIAFALEQAGADALELFLRSPEEGGPADPLRIVSLVSAAVRVPVGLRITPGLARLGENAEALAQAGAKGLVLFHAPLGFITHPDDLESREEELLTGPAVFRLALPALAALARNHPAPPLDLSAAGPVSASGDLFSALLSGAGAVYVTPEPENLRRLEEMLKAWMEAKGFASLREIRAFFLRDRERLSGVESEAHRGGS